MPIFVDWLNVRCIIFTSAKVRIWRKKYPREYRIVYYQFPPLTEYPHLLQLEEILGSSGILRADLGFAVLSMFFVISYRYNIKMGVEAEILVQPKFHYFSIDFGFEKGNLTVSILQIMTVMILSILSTPSFHFQICPTRRPSDDASPDPEKSLSLGQRFPDWIATDDKDCEPPAWHA